MAEWLVLIAVYTAAVGFVVLALKRPGASLVASFCVFVAGAVLAAWMRYDGPGRFPSLIFFATLVAVVLSRGRPDADRWPQSLAKWTLIVLALGLLLMTWLGVGAIFSPMGVLFGAIMLGLILRFLLLSRRAVTHYVVSTISACMRQHLPLAGALAAAAEGRTDKRAKVLRQISGMLLRGHPLSLALRFGHRACPGDVVATIEAAERIDRLPQALQRLEADMLSDTRQRHRIQPCPLWYPLAVVFALGLIVSWTALFTMPAFERLLYGMGHPLPGATQNVLSVWRFVGVLTPVLILGALVAVPVAIYAKFRARRADRFQLLARVGDFVKWHLPIGRWFERSRSTVQVVKVLRLSLEAGLPLDHAIATTLGLDVNHCFRWRLRQWLGRVRQGQDVSQAARAVGLGRSVAWAFDQRANPGSTPAALETLESIYRSNYSYRARLARFIGWPLIVLALAGLVGYTVYALYLPLIELTRYTMITVIP